MKYDRIKVEVINLANKKKKKKTNNTILTTDISLKDLKMEQKTTDINNNKKGK